MLIVPTTQPEEIEQYSIRVVEQVEARPQGRRRRRAAVVVASNDRRVRIEVGYGLEGALPDATANRIIEQDIAPQFKRGDYLRRHQHRRRSHHARHRRRAVAGPGAEPACGRRAGPVQLAAVPVHLCAGRRLDPAPHVRSCRRRAGHRRRGRVPDLDADQRPRYFDRRRRHRVHLLAARRLRWRTARRQWLVQRGGAAAGVSPAASAAGAAGGGGFGGGGGFSGGGGGFGGGGASGGW